MSEAYETIVFAVIVLFIVLRVRGAVNKAGKEAERRKKDAEVNRQVGITPQQTKASFAAANSAGRMIQERQTAVNRPAAAVGSASSPINYPSAVPGAGQAQRRNTRPQMPVKPAQNPQAKATAGDDEMSTTEMLAKKAKQDQIEHQREKLEQKRHEQKYYSNYNYAKRYLLGDPVSPSEKMIICPNCAAENLIKIHENPKKYNCYFCREKLE